ncbi:serine/threonine-protein kinase [Candidatus Uabimicrobium amorphum]|uniref:Protein kinase n=1 Tax=Uabimicrobium amorphum TaxID=2596890 RepID=A0A5S9F5F7_UABAM|nr:serine/threonine-protein kinase [Candidatus Uabimicrobium amorphum]BBM86558.1 protein kinase [Candidatus Uabimicrobium amorphum]
MKIIAERYQLCKVLGQGGMGRVFLAQDIKTKQYVAIKECTIKNEQSAKRVEREYYFMLKINHENIVRGFDLIKNDNHYFIVMEYIEGISLQDFIRRYPKSIDFNKQWDIIKQICEAVIVLHENDIIHRDLKPSNIMLVGDELQPKLLDFGIAKSEQLTNMTKTGVMVGSPGYMSPEQIDENKNLRSNTDVFSLGVICYQFLRWLEHSPFYGGNVISTMDRTYSTNLPLVFSGSQYSHEEIRLSEIIDFALKKDQDTRLQKVEDFLVWMANPQAQIYTEINIGNQQTLPKKHVAKNYESRLQKYRSEKQTKKKNILFVPLLLLLLTPAVYFLISGKGKDSHTNTNHTMHKKQTNRDTIVHDLIVLAKKRAYAKALQHFEYICDSEEKYTTKMENPFYKLVMHLCNKDYEKALSMTKKVLQKDYHGFGLYLCIHTFALNGEILLGTWYSSTFVEKYKDFYAVLKSPVIDMSLYQEEAYNKWKEWKTRQEEKQLCRQYMIAQILRKQPSRINWNSVRKNMTNNVYLEICEVLYYSQMNISYKERYQQLQKIANKNIMRNKHFPWYMLLMISKNTVLQRQILKRMPQYHNFYPVEILTSSSVENSDEIVRRYTNVKNSEMIKRALYCSVVNKRHYDKIDSLIEFFPAWPEGYILKSNTSPSLKTLSGFVSINLGKLSDQSQQIYTRCVGKLSHKEAIVFYWNLRRIKTVHKRMSEVLNSRLSVIMSQIDELISILENVQPKLRKQRSPYFYIEESKWSKAARFIRREDSQNRLFYQAVYETERLYKSLPMDQDLKNLQRAKELFDKTQTAQSKWRDHGLFLVEYINLMMAYHIKNYMVQFKRPQYEILGNIWFEYIYTRLMNEMATQQKDNQKFYLQKERGLTLAYIQRANQFKKTLQFDKMRRDLNIAAFLYPLFSYKHPIDRQNIEQFLKNRQK